MLNHVLIVGGTGMLQGAAMSMVRHAKESTLISRDLARMSLVAEHGPPGTRMLSIDYKTDNSFPELLASTFRSKNPPDLVVAWVHGESAASTIMLQLGQWAPHARLIHVLGNSSAQHSFQKANQLRSWAESAGLTCYQQVVLCGIFSNGIFNRWLNDSEISDGVLDAFDTRAAMTVIGDPVS